MIQISPANAVLAGLTSRCPNCGKGPLFGGFLKVAPVCTTCGFDLSKADSGDGPVVFIIILVGSLCGFGALIFDFSLHPPIWVDIVIWLPLAGVLSVGLIRPLKSLMIALQFYVKAQAASHDG